MVSAKAKPLENHVQRSYCKSKNLREKKKNQPDMLSFVMEPVDEVNLISN